MNDDEDDDDHYKADEIGSGGHGKGPKHALPSFASNPKGHTVIYPQCTPHNCWLNNDYH
jgi:hypothetical protein